VSTGGNATSRGPAPSDARIRLLLVLAIAVAAAFVLFWRLGSASLADWDEAIYAQMAKEMVRDGEWLTPHWGGRHWFEKPPLFTWLTAIHFKFFGISEFWARATSALAGVGLVLITYLTGKAIYGRKAVGCVAAVVLLSHPHFVYFSRFGTTDILLTTFIMLSIYAYLRVEQTGRHTWWYVVWAAFGLAVMAKWVGALVAPMSIAATAIINRRHVVALRSRHFWAGLVLGAVIAAPWHISMLALHGQEFLRKYVGKDIIARTSTALEGNVGGAFYYIDELQKGFFPWTYLCLFALAYVFKDILKGQRRALVLFVLVLLVIGIYSGVQTKLPWYSSPVYPPLSILVAALIVHAFRWHDSIAFAGLAIAGLVAALSISSASAALLAGAGFVLLASGLLRRPVVRRGLTILLCGLLAFVGMRTLRPQYQAGFRSVAYLARIAASQDEHDREPLILLHSFDEPTALFYSDRPILEADTFDELEHCVDGSKLRRIILRKRHVDRVSEAYELHLLAEYGRSAYGVIKRKNR
jgi:4-amino-4-deoxy-L-arabinose transferase-like glycosyltransferase